MVSNYWYTVFLGKLFFTVSVEDNSKLITFYSSFKGKVRSNRGCVYFQEETTPDYDALFLCIKYSSVQEENSFVRTSTWIYAGSGKYCSMFWDISVLKSCIRFDICINYKDIVNCCQHTNLYCLQIIFKDCHECPILMRLGEWFSCNWSFKML